MNKEVATDNKNQSATATATATATPKLFSSRLPHRHFHVTFKSKNELNRFLKDIPLLQRLRKESYLLPSKDNKQFEAIISYKAETSARLSKWTKQGLKAVFWNRPEAFNQDNLLSKLIDYVHQKYPLQKPLKKKAKPKPEPEPEIELEESEKQRKRKTETQTQNSVPVPVPERDGSLSLNLMLLNFANDVFLNNNSKFTQEQFALPDIDQNYGNHDDELIIPENNIPRLGFGIGFELEKDEDSYLVQKNIKIELEQEQTLDEIRQRIVGLEREKRELAIDIEKGKKELASTLNREMQLAIAFENVEKRCFQLERENKELTNRKRELELERELNDRIVQFTELRELIDRNAVELDDVYRFQKSFEELQKSSVTS